MDINGGRIQRFMSKEGLDSKKIGTILVEMGAESMAEGVAGKAMDPAKLCFAGENGLVYGVGDHMLVRMAVFREKPSHGFAGWEPVISKNLQGVRRKNGITVRASFGMTDMNAHVGT